MVLFVIDQDSIDELTSYSQNTESEYKRAIIICQKIVYRINGFDNAGCLAKDIKGKLEECILNIALLLTIYFCVKLEDYIITIWRIWA